MQELEASVVKLAEDMQRQYELLQDMKKHVRILMSYWYEFISSTVFVFAV